MILAGINTTTCVLCAAVEATNRDFRVVVAADAVDSMDGEDMHRFALVILVLAVIVAAVGLGAPSWAQKGPIKIGMLVPQSGPLAANGKDMINGFELFFEEHKCGGTFTDEHVLRVQGDEVLGVITPLHYSAVLDNAANTKVAAAYEAKYKQVPSYDSEGTYVAGVTLKSALEAIGGDIENVDRFLAAVRRVDLSESPRGPIKFDEFWTYKPEEFLKNPVYSRDYPPGKAC